VTSWTDDPGRYTRDVDFLAFGADDGAELARIFAEIMAHDANDGLVFDTTGVAVTDIRKGQTYGGWRLRTTARLGQARIPITIDLGFGDALGDPDYRMEYRSLLDFGPVTIRACSPATVVAEKFHAVVLLGLLNTRMKNLHDLVSVPATMAIDHDEFVRTVVATFERRATEVPARRPAGLSAAFATDSAKKTQWAAYSEGTSLEGVTLAEVVDRIWATVGPVVRRDGKDVPSLESDGQNDA